jgi:hypothetical protein
MSGPFSDERRWEQLNALVDGELDASSLAEATAWIAEDREAAKALATIAALKAATASHGRSAAMPERGRRWGRVAKLAAVLALSAGLGGLLVYGLLIPQAPETAVAFAPRTMGLRDDVTIGGVRLPNLETSGLRLETIEVSQHDHGPRMEAAYVGERGCRVRLVVAYAADAGHSLGRETSGHIRRWSVGPFVYTLTGERMDPQRFAAVAQLAQADTARGSSPPSQLAGLSQDLKNRPCLG